LEVNDPQTDPRLTYEIVEETHWYIDFFGDLIDIDALARNGPSRIEVPTQVEQAAMPLHRPLLA
jgi:hypothetical protein